MIYLELIKLAYCLRCNKACCASVRVRLNWQSFALRMGYWWWERHHLVLHHRIKCLGLALLLFITVIVLNVCSYDYKDSAIYY